MVTVRNSKGQFVKGFTPDGSIIFVKGQKSWNKGLKFPERSLDKSSGWKGGRTLHQGKYWLVYKPQRPCCDNKGYVREHRLVLEECLGRYLRKDELVHHKDGNTLNNNPLNLGLVNRSDHMKMHKQEIYIARWGKS